MSTLSVNLRGFRVYGAGFQYGEKPRTNPLGHPIELNNYPTKSTSAIIILGEFPEWIKRGYSVTWATELGKYPSDKDKPEDLQARIELLSNSEVAQFPEEKWKWYVTITIERTIELNEKYLCKNKYRWIEYHESLRIANQYREENKVYTDRLAAYLGPLVGPEYFTEIVCKGFYFIASNRITYGPLEITGGTARLIIGRPLTSFTNGNFEETVERIKKISEGDEKSLDSARHWYLEALKETDEWKKFSWTFLALEVLINKLSERYYQVVLSELTLHRDVDNQQYEISHTIDKLLPPLNKLNLVGKLTIVALALCPEKADTEIAIFKEAKKARDRLSHGTLKKAEELPCTQTHDLLLRLFDLTMKKWLT